MSAHYCSEEDPETTFIVLDGPDEGEFWDDEVPANGRHVLLVGEPWGHACHAVVGTLAQLQSYARRITQAVSNGSPAAVPPAGEATVDPSTPDEEPKVGLPSTLDFHGIVSTLVELYDQYGDDDDILSRHQVALINRARSFADRDQD